MNIDKFALYLEKAGYEGALKLIEKELLPLAKKKQISLLDAAWEYANQDEEQDTSWFQLFHALQRIGPKILKSPDLNISQPIMESTLPLFP
ncbi:hypothetical protein KJ590_01320 [Patescibacteria group bacterium]|nr:hypothetical protein [Patescibacteria group bacterium]MBU4142625.1 hypothetical protein [Patescibacteria group bacterium]